MGRFVGRRRDERGVTIVEAAIIIPVFFVPILLGFFEFGLGFKDYLTESYGVRTGARTESAAKTSDTADLDTLKTLKRALTAIPTDTITKIVVYKATDSPTVPPECTGDVGSPGKCNVYIPSRDFSRIVSSPLDYTCSATYAGTYAGFWCSHDRDSTVDGGLDKVGVWIQVKHQLVSHIFGNQWVLTDSNVARLEPERNTLS